MFTNIIAFSSSCRALFLQQAYWIYEQVINVFLIQFEKVTD